jgi:hypothetical protein
MEPKVQLGYATNSVVPPQEQVFEQVYMKVQGDPVREAVIGYLSELSSFILRFNLATLSSLSMPNPKLFTATHFHSLM